MNLQLHDAKSDASEAQSSVGLGSVFAGIRRHPILIVFFLILTVVASGAAWFFLPLPKMTGYATISIKAQPDALFRPDGDAKIDFNMYRQTQAARIKSLQVIKHALDEAHIRNLHLLPRERPADQDNWLEKQLKVDFKMGSELMRISMEGNDPEDLRKIIEAVTKTYLSEVVKDDLGNRKERLGQLTGLYVKWKDDLKDKRLELKKVSDIKDGEFVSPAEKEKLRQEQIAELQTDLNQKNREKILVVTEMETLSKRVENAKDLLVPETAITAALELDAGYQKLAEKKRVLVEKIDNDRKNSAEGVVVSKLKDKIVELAVIDKEIIEYANKLRPQLKEKYQHEAVQRDIIHLDETRKKVAILEAVIQSIEGSLKERQKPSKNFDSETYNKIAAEVANLELQTNKVYNEMKSIEAELQIAKNPENKHRVTIFEPATAVPGIESNRRIKYTGIIGCGILFMGLGLVTFLEFSNRRVKDSNGVATALGLRVLGTVPSLPTQSRGQPMSSDQALAWQQRVIESVDNARTMLLHGIETSRPIRTVMITSALSGEGKSSLAGHLAVSLARAGFRTLLIDADMRRPCLHRVMGVPLQTGFSEYLQGIATLDEVIYDSPVSGLTIIPAGLWHPSLPRALAGSTWPNLKAQLESEFDYIVVDSSPILPVADSLLLARNVDGVLLSLLNDVSHLGAAAAAKERLLTVRTNILGVVINGMDNQFYSSTYAYGAQAVADSAAPSA